MSGTIESQFGKALESLASITMDAIDYQAVTDRELVQLASLSGDVQRTAGARAAIIAGEVARRSAPNLGSSGLAQSSGFRTAEELMRSATGSTAREATQSVRVGRLANGDDEREWLISVGAAVVDEGLSVASAEAISNGLGAPSVAVTTDELAAAALQLCEEAVTLDSDRLYRRARDLRDELDAAGIAERESSRRDERSLRFHRRHDGMARLTWEMDPETAALVGEVYDRTTSPRRGGPRFVEGRAAELAGQIAADSRSTEQIASDTFLQLLRQGTDADSSQLLGTGAPSIRVLVTEQALTNRRGHGRIEGQPGSISIETVERLICSGDTITIGFDEGQPLDLGREQRFYTRKQRIALAARDGGCRWPGCERPPSWTEAHHTKFWARDRGPTDVVDGILLCKHHHLLAHNNHWEIHRTGNDYWLTPPTDQDPLQKPVIMPTKSRALNDLKRETRKSEVALAR